MNEASPSSSEPTVNQAPYWAYGVIAIVSGIVSLLIALIALSKFQTVTDGGMFGIAFMILSPGAVGVAICVLVYLTAKIQAERAAPARPYESTPPPSDGITAFPPRRYDS